MTPRSSADRIERAEWTQDGGWHLQARVRAVPEKGRANAALATLLAGELGLAKSGVALEGGGRSREKLMRVEASADEVADALSRFQPGK